jgi:ATP-binding cassette subfamily F protein 3
LFALAAFHAPHILVLDEPTNHLDVDSRQALVHALNDFEGCIILISHDRHLIETVADRLWLVAQGTATPYAGDIHDYTGYVLERSRAGRGKPDSRRQETSGVQPKRPAAILKRIREIEAGVTQLEEKIRILDRALADQQLYSDDPAKAHGFSQLRARLQNELESFELCWLEAHSELEDRQG